MSSADAAETLEMRRRRIRFRAWHRGTRELDLLIGRFADAELASLSASELDDLEALLEAQDRDVFGWLTGELATPAAFDTPLLRRIRAFHTHDTPLYR